MTKRVTEQYERTTTSIGDISRGTGISRTYVGRVMSGKRTPTIHNCAKIAAYLGITLDAFYARLCTSLEREKKQKGKKAKGPKSLTQPTTLLDSPAPPVL